MLNEQNVDMDTLEELERERLEFEELEREYSELYPDKSKEN